MLAYLRSFVKRIFPIPVGQSRNCLAGEKPPLRPLPFSPCKGVSIHTWSAQCTITPFPLQRAWVKPLLDVENGARCPLSTRVTFDTANARISVLATTSISFLR